MSKFIEITRGDITYEGEFRTLERFIINTNEIKEVHNILICGEDHAEINLKNAEFETHKVSFYTAEPYDKVKNLLLT